MQDFACRYAFRRENDHSQTRRGVFPLVQIAGADDEDLGLGVGRNDLERLPFQKRSELFYEERQYGEGYPGHAPSIARDGKANSVDVYGCSRLAQKEAFGIKLALNAAHLCASSRKFAHFFGGMQSGVIDVSH